jgi:hypothetical protein
MRSSGLILCGAAASLGLATAAFGQSAPDLRLATTDDSLASVTPLPAPEEQPSRRRTADPNPYDPVGLRTGGITWHAALAMGTEASTNVTHTDDSGGFGAGATLKPEVSFASDWVRHSWTGSASASLTRYLDHPEMAVDNVSAASAFRLDIRRDTVAEFSAGYSLDNSANVDTGVAGSEIGDATVHTATAAAALDHDFGPLALRGTAAVTRKIYADVALSGGGTQDNGDRDYWEPQLALRATYTDPPVVKPFIEAAYTPRLHAQRLDRNGIARNSQGIDLKAGVAVDDGPIWTGELALTYLHRSYADATLSANGAWGVTGSVNWSPTELTKLSLTLGTSLTESTAAGYSGGSLWSAHLDGSRAVRDNVDVTAGAGLTYETTATGADVTYDGSLGLLWKLNRHVALSAGYDFTWLDAAETARGYVNHTVSAGVVLRQ